MQACAVLWSVPAWIWLAYMGLSVLTFMMYWQDKWAAQKGQWRTPEKTLQMLALAGGWPGAVLAQQWLRQQGYRVRLFPRGALALKAAAANPPDLILHLAPGGSNVGLTHCKLSDMGDTGQGHQCQHGADSGQHRRNNQSPTYGPEYLGYRASRGGFIFNTHELS